MPRAPSPTPPVPDRLDDGMGERAPQGEAAKPKRKPKKQASEAAPKPRKSRAKRESDQAPKEPKPRARKSSTPRKPSSAPPASEERRIALESVLRAQVVVVHDPATGDSDPGLPAQEVAA
ncbi:MAG TPA: hypothetical protein VI299_10530, partial [Polyangiales bacterium]